MIAHFVLLTAQELTELIVKSVREALVEQQLPTTSPSKPLTIDEAAAYLRLPKATLYQMTSAREIPHQKLGKRLVFLKEELDDWIASKRQKTRSEIERDDICHSSKQRHK
ncbi:excisionase family DNA binding protein [Runella defluvii]|uniref:Excisionase family DNA binding protein n=1 Tax=Runella defluvii TaxID=370973 RepID=A0A7W5ZGP3_9BACT|nr:helix-turn-helix domain-containing protein [Runella defluvii]MBB3836992.1 excisionase family DNA binding protein [Runella defluvii]